MNSRSVSWRSQQQPVVALSTSEAKYMGSLKPPDTSLGENPSFLIFFHQQIKPPPFLTDRASSVSFITEDAIKKRSKHLFMRFHYIQKQNQTENIEIIRIPTTQVSADLFLRKELANTLLSKGLLANAMP